MCGGVSPECPLITSPGTTLNGTRGLQRVRGLCGGEAKGDLGALLICSLLLRVVATVQVPIVQDKTLGAWRAPTPPATYACTSGTLQTSAAPHPTPAAAAPHPALPAGPPASSGSSPGAAGSAPRPVPPRSPARWLAGDCSTGRAAGAAGRCRRRPGHGDAPLSLRSARGRGAGEPGGRGAGSPRSAGPTRLRRGPCLGPSQLGLAAIATRPPGRWPRTRRCRRPSSTGRRSNA